MPFRNVCEAFAVMSRDGKTFFILTWPAVEKLTF